MQSRSYLSRYRDINNNCMHLQPVSRNRYTSCISPNRLSSVRLLTASLPAGSSGLFWHTSQQVFAQVNAFRLQTLRLQQAANDIPTGSKPLFIIHRALIVPPRGNRCVCGSGCKHLVLYLYLPTVPLTLTRALGRDSPNLLCSSFDSGSMLENPFPHTQSNQQAYIQIRAACFGFLKNREVKSVLTLVY